MAAASSSFESGGIRKMRLQKTPMFVNRLQKGREERYICFTFTFNNFTKLEPMCVYSKHEPVKRWHYTLVKGEKDMTITFFSFFNDAFQLMPKCYVSHQRRKQPRHVLSDYRSCGHVLEVKPGIYELTIPLECFNGPEFRLEDKVHVQIRFNPDRQLDTVVGLSCGDVKDQWHQLLWNDLFIKEDFHDFMIFAHDKVRTAPKGLCAARSSLFRDHLAKYGESMGYELPLGNNQFDFQLFASAVLFLKRGLFQVPNDVQSVMNLLTLAEIMGMPSLQSLCTVVIQDDLNMLEAQEEKALKEYIEYEHEYDTEDE